MASFLFSLAFVVLGIFFLLVAAWAGWGIVHMLRASHRSQQYLEASSDDPPLQLDHLSPALQELVQGTRLLRISLESPLREVMALLEGELRETAAHDIDAFDNMLMDVSRQVAEWLTSVDRLPEQDRATLTDLGASPEGIRRVLDTEGGAFERRHLRRHGLPSMDQRLHRVVEELTRIEGSLQTPSLRPYR